jgi:hypothetical protein
MEKLRAAEKVRLFELEKELTTRKQQIATLTDNLSKQKVPKTQLETKGRIAEAERLKREVEIQLEGLATVKSDYEEAVRQNDSLKEQLKASQKRFDELAEQQQAQQLAAGKRAAQLEARCQLIQKDNPLPESISHAREAIPQDIDASNVVDAGWALDDLEGLLDAEEKRLREAHPGRDDFLAALAKLEQQARLIEEEDLASETYRAAHEKKLAALRLLATRREYAEALKQATQLLEDMQAWIEAARKAQTALEDALNEALDDIAFYEDGDNVEKAELTEMRALVEEARSHDDVDDALEFVTKTVKPKIKKFLVDQAKWRKVSAPVRERRPRQPPNYDDAARRIVDDVLRLFGSNFRYAGPSLDVQQLYPRERYNPGRLKQAVRVRFASLSPAAALPGKGLGARCYFNLGAGGTTKKKYEYNVKVKREGVDQALAQIHIVYP